MQTTNSHELYGSTQVRLLIAGAAVTIIVIAVVLLTAPPLGQTSLSAARLASDPALGSPGAKVTVVEYGDFGCSTCQSWEQAGVLKQITAAYGDRIRFVWRDYPIVSAQSPEAAEAAQCAYDQGKFWEYHDLLYQRAPALGTADLKSYAAGLGLNLALFDQCLDSDQDKPKLDRSLGEAQALGLIGTPAFVINGHELIGPASLAQFKSVIDPLLAGG